MDEMEGVEGHSIAEVDPYDALKPPRAVADVSKLYRLQRQGQ